MELLLQAVSQCIYIIFLFAPLYLSLLIHTPCMVIPILSFSHLAHLPLRLLIDWHIRQGAGTGAQ